MESDFALLLVEPEEQQKKLVEDVLRTEFDILDVTSTISSKETMSLLNKQAEIQCIIVSSILKDSDGFALIQDIRAISKYSKTPVLIMSDIQERDYLLKAAASGASDFIVKPFNPRSLTLKLKKLLSGKQFRKAPRFSALETFDVDVSFEKVSYKCKLIDISSGGCSVKTPTFQQGGAIFDRVTINITNNGHPLIVDAEFAQAKRDPESEDKEEKSQIANFQFMNLDNATVEAIANFIKSAQS